jgi:hypothetical protein
MKPKMNMDLKLQAKAFMTTLDKDIYEVNKNIYTHDAEAGEIAKILRTNRKTGDDGKKI